MAEVFAPGDYVRAARTDPPHHCRLPRYVRGAVGIVVESQGNSPLPDDRARGLLAASEPVFTVRFSAQELFGSGDHSVTVDIWGSHLAAATESGPR